MNSRLKQIILETLNIGSFETLETVQSLWGGYGSICRIQIGDKDSDTAILKHIQLHKKSSEADSVSYRRKLKSYRIETRWYRNFSNLCTENCRIPSFICAGETEDELFILLEDLNRNGYTHHTHRLNPNRLSSCIRWLANFHAIFLHKSPEQLWEIGSYWHLETRQEEFNRMPGGPLKDKAHELDSKLNAATYRTIIHGDAKPSNFCFKPDNSVAAVDFQYVGGGCGIKDLAYLLYGTSPSEEQPAIDFYFHQLQNALLKHNPSESFSELKKEWSALYPIAQADFERFLQGW